jgi:hypothetical protein
MQKFGEDDKVEQMNQNKRRMRELEHKRDVEELWQQKLSLYRAQRDEELQEMEAKRMEEARIQQLVSMEKARLMAEHEAILKQHYPKAAARLM